MNTDDLVKLAMNKDLHNVLRGPLGGPLWHFLEVFLSDLAVRLGIDALQSFGKSKNPTDPATSAGSTTIDPPRLPASLKLLEIFLTLPRDQRGEIAAWFQDIQNNDKRKLGLVSEETLTALLALSAEERTEALSILEDSSFETMSKALKRIDPEMPKTAEFFQRFGDWGRSVDPPIVDEPDFIRRNTEALITYIASLLPKILRYLGTLARDKAKATLHGVWKLLGTIQSGFRRIVDYTQDMCLYAYIQYVEIKTRLMRIPYRCITYVRDQLRSRKP